MAGETPAGAPDGPDTRRPAFRVVNADATPEEVAAVVAVLSALGGVPAAPARVRSAWSHPARGVRRTLPHGRGGWRSSGLPR